MAKWERLRRLPASMRVFLLVLTTALFALATFHNSDAVGPGPVRSDLYNYASNYAHQVLFFAMSFSWLLARGAARPGKLVSLLVVLSLALAFGYLDEWNQSVSPARLASLWDIVSDLFGATLGWSFARALNQTPGAMRWRHPALLWGVGLFWGLIPATSEYPVPFLSS